MSQSLEHTIIEMAATPGNVSLPKEGATPEKSGAPKGSGGSTAPPSQSTDPGGNFKASEKAGDATKKTKGRRGDKEGKETPSEPTTIADPGKKILSPETVKEEEMEDETTEVVSEEEVDDLVVKALDEMDEDELRELLDTISVQEDGEEIDENVDEDEEVESYTFDRITAEDLNISDDLTVIVSGEEGLSEEFQNNARILFESAVVAKVNEKIDELEGAYNVQIDEAVENISANLTEKVDGYLDYVVKEWMEENELAIERGIRSEITEEFITGLKSLFENHYIDMPEEKVDVAEALAEKVENLESQLNQVVESNIELQRELGSKERSNLVDELTNDLADTDSEKLRGLAEGIEFEDTDQYKDALVTLRNKYFPKSDPSMISEEVIEEGLDVDNGLSGAMAAYTNTLGRTVRN